jgi:hypothetical protein
LILKHKTLDPGLRRGDVYRVFRPDVGIPTLFHHPVRYLNLKSVLFLAKVLVTISAVNLFGSGRQKFRRFMLQGALHCNALKNWGEG